MDNQQGTVPHFSPAIPVGEEGAGEAASVVTNDWCIRILTKQQNLNRRRY